MERVQAAFLSLLRAGLWERDPETDGIFPLSEEEWRGVYGVARKQAVTGTVAWGVFSLPPDFQPSDVRFAEWVVEHDRVVRANSEMDSALSALSRFFAHAGLHPVLQKGQGVAGMYATPSLRECGDIDLYFPQKEEAMEALELVRKSGAEVTHNPDGSESYLWEGVEVEHHPYLVDISSPFKRGWLRRLESELGFVPSPLGEGLRIPAPELNLLLLDAHILKHAIGKGVGFRQICDMARACHTYCGCSGPAKGQRTVPDAAKVREIYRKAGLLKWSGLLHSFLTDILSLPSGELPYESPRRDPAPLLGMVSSAGNFGLHSSRKSQLTDSAVGGGAVSNNATDGSGVFGTARAFMRNLPFSMAYAPCETISQMLTLAFGQFGRRNR